jgi:glycosyltransferase involved in cell wall biosynthesis
MFLAKVLSILTRRALVFDVYQSLHDTVVFDRELASQSSMIARLVYFLDKCSCLLADVVLLDTNAHIDHFYRKFGVEKSNFRRVFVGVNDRHLEPTGGVANGEEEEGIFMVTYFGGYVPLHGLEHVIEAAKELIEYPDIKFSFIGNGQMYEAIRLLASELGLKNVTFFETGLPGQWMSLEELAAYIVKADVCLGIFGLGAKAAWVIPNKIPTAFAMKKPVITGDTSAVREAFVNGESILLCERGNAQALAEAILLLRANRKLRQEIAQNGYEVFLRAFSIKAVGRQVKDVLIGLKRGAVC